MGQCVKPLLVEHRDSEFPDGLPARMEEHLSDGLACWTESEGLERLSKVLNAYTLPNTFCDAETFRARVMLRVPRRKAAPAAQASWAWYAVPVSLVCAWIVSQGALSLAGALGLIAGTVGWSGVEASSQAGAWLSGSISSDALRGLLASSLPLVLYVLLQAVVGLGLILVFVPYVGWVTMLLRAETGPGTSEGERNGTL